MNNRLALALIIGFLVSMITALMTAEVRYYDLGLGKKEIKEREYCNLPQKQEHLKI